MNKSIEQGNFRYVGCCLAKCYLNGTGTEKNIEKGFKILRKTAFQGYDGETVNLLIHCYEKGIGTPKSKKNAAFWKQQKKEQLNLIEE